MTNTGSKVVDIRAGKETGKLPIKEFRFDMFAKNPAIVMIAKRGSGKSWVIRAILEYFKNIPAGLIISPTDRMSCFYGKFFPDTYIFYEFSSEIIERVFSRQRFIIDKQKEKIEKGKNLDPRCFIIMDDCLGNKKAWNHDPVITELLFNGRHYEIMYILALQYPLGITPDMRSNFDYIFLLADDFISNKKKMYDNYAGMFPSFDSFSQVFQQLTDDFGSMVIANRGARDSIFEKVYYYKAPDLSNHNNGNYGCKQFRDYHKNNYNKDWRKKVEKFDPDDYLKNKKKTKGIVLVDKIKNTDESDRNKKKKRY